MTKLSVILPVFNVEQYLSQCLDSIVNQTLKEIEIICINDGSTDNSAEILSKYALKDNRFIIINQENKGQGVARNKGLDIASGEYITFVDPDDWLDVHAFEAAYTEIKRNGADVLSYDYIEYRENSGKYRKRCFADVMKKVCDYDLRKNNLYNINSVSLNQFDAIQLFVWNKLYSRDFIEKCHIRFAENKFGEDHIFSLVTFLRANKVCYLDKFFYYYRTRKTSSTVSFSDDNFCIFDNVELFKQYLIENDLYDKFENEFVKYRLDAYKWHYGKVLSTSRENYLYRCKCTMSEYEYDKFLKQTLCKQNFIQKIVSGWINGKAAT